MTITFKYNGKLFNLSLSERVTCITGDSGTGKTYLLKTFLNYLDDENIPSTYISRKTDFLAYMNSNVKSFKYILLDRFDMWATDEIRSFIANDINVQYIINTRKIYGLGVPMLHRKEIGYDSSKNTIELVGKRHG
jgi:GTPase SAR1 family protein